MGVATRVDRGSRSAHLALPWVVALACLALPVRANVVGDIASVGLRSGADAAGGGWIVRAGAWVPIAVELDLENQEVFEGSLRVRQRDSDGDYGYDEVPVYLQAEGGLKRFELYVVAGAEQRASDFAVTLYDAKKTAVTLISGGEKVRQLAPRAEVRVVPAREYVIAVMTLPDRPIGRIARLTAADQDGKHWKPLHLAHITPSSVPTRWIGLELADCIVWDEADATALTRPQTIALVEWVKHGGKLLIASAKAADTLAKSELLGPLLPVDVGPVVSTTDLPNMEAHLLGGSSATGKQGSDYAVPVPVARCTLRQDGNARSMLTETIEGADTVLISERPVGRGRLIFVAGALRDLLSRSESPVPFFNKVLGLRGAPTGQEQHSDSQVLFPAVQDAVGFAGIGGAYMVVAFLFALAYVGLATFGVWGLLKSRGWTQYSWPGFAAAALAASVVSVVAVQSVRGVGNRLHQLTIVDLVAGRNEAEATCYFGLKTGTHTRLDVWLPSAYPHEKEPGESQCFLRPLTEWHNDTAGSEGGFMDPDAYRVHPAEAELSDVPMRATLKRFEGRWAGPLSGGVSASIRLLRDVTLGEAPLLEEQGDKRSRADVFSPDSEITNNLGVDLEMCYILHAERDAFEAPGFVCTSPRGKESPCYARAHQLRGGIRKGETVRLANRLYVDATGKPVSGEDWAQHSRLFAAQNDWGSRFAGLALVGGHLVGDEFALEEPFQNALLLLSTLDEYDPMTLKGGGLAFEAERCRFLDMSDRLRKDTVVLIGFARDAGPVKLCVRRGSRDYRPVTPSQAWTMYRVVIPLRG